jgi:hypothetical protein
MSTMPSAQHESPIELVKQDPSLVAWLLTNLFDIKVPDYHHARPHATDVRVLVPRTYHADGMVLFCDPDDQPLLSVVLEVQRGKDRAKRRTWKLYVAQLEAELDVTAGLLVFCPDPGVARWYEQLIASDGLSLLLRPLLFTPKDIPLVVDVDLARANPAVAVLSVICHGDQAVIDSVFPALAEMLRSVGDVKANLYYDIVLAGLPKPARLRWEAFMTTAGYQYRSEFALENQAIGQAIGEGRALLKVLDVRGIAVTDAVREKVLACTDLDRLDIWLDRAVTATTAEEVIRE